MTNREHNIIYADVLIAAKSTEELCALPVAGLSAKDCVLFLWVAFPRLPDALKVIEAWGFQYKTVAFVLNKRSRRPADWQWGMKYWTQPNAQLCLLATKGTPSKCVQQMIDGSCEYSRKPNEIREKIVEVMGDLPRIELFPREKADGWDIFGNEVIPNIALAPGS